MDLFAFLLCVTLILWGVTIFVPERILIVLAAITAIMAGVIGLVRMF